MHACLQLLLDNSLKHMFFNFRLEIQVNNFAYIVMDSYIFRDQNDQYHFRGIFCSSASEAHIA